MIENLDALQTELEKVTITNTNELEEFRLKWLSKNGILNSLFDEFKTVPNQEKKAFGQKLNVFKNSLEEILKSKTQEFKSNSNDLKIEDSTLIGDEKALGSLHPISILTNKICDIFERMGFNISTGPEIVDDWHNFEALNFAADHPARDMQDTFFVSANPELLLRTHTSSVQVKEMMKEKLPIRTISPGRVYRNETISSRSHCFFHQIEGLYIAKESNFTDLKSTLYSFAKELFGPEIKIRFRPSYFPFTEPSAEMDIYRGLETEADYRITKGTGWLEILGCGMVDPNVLVNCGIDPNIYTGYAFGVGIERLALLLYNLNDIRMFSENDARFLKQFAGLY